MPYFILAKILLAALFASNLHPGDPKSAETGTWGGDRMILEVSEKGAEVELDCAHGNVTQPMELDKRGDFDVAGTFTPEHGGPVRRDEINASSPAHYSGHVEGTTMTLTIVYGEKRLGPFTLTHGARPLLTKCR